MKPTPLPIRPLLEAGSARAYFTTRGEIVAANNYSGFNLCHYTGDDEKHYTVCRDMLANHFGSDSVHIIIPRQTHSTRVLSITESLPTDEELDGVDAIVTRRRDIIIGVNTADCVPVVLIDPIENTIGVAHAGWRGAVAGIVNNTIEAMTALGSRPENIHAAMGPSICLKCFEVGEDVAKRFPEECVDRNSWEKPHVSLQKYIFTSLIQSGLHTSNILPINSAECTRCNPDIYFSARASGIKSGRIFTFATFLPEK